MACVRACVRACVYVRALWAAACVQYQGLESSHQVSEVQLDMVEAVREAQGGPAPLGGPWVMVLRQDLLPHSLQHAPVDLEAVGGLTETLPLLQNNASLDSNLQAQPLTSRL